MYWNIVKENEVKHYMQYYITVFFASRKFVNILTFWVPFMCISFAPNPRKKCILRRQHKKKHKQEIKTLRQPKNPNQDSRRAFSTPPPPLPFQLPLVPLRGWCAPLRINSHPSYQSRINRGLVAPSITKPTSALPPPPHSRPGLTRLDPWPRRELFLPPQSFVIVLFRVWKCVCLCVSAGR